MVETFPAPIVNHRKRDKVDTPSPHIHLHDHSPSRLGTGISIKSGGAKLVLRIPSL